MSEPVSLALNDHVVGEILSYCDISTVLACAQVSRHWCILASSKQLWIRLLRPLQDADLVPDIPQDVLDASSTADLIAQVKRIVLGPGSWSPWTPSVIPTTPLSPKIATSIRQHSRFQVADSSDAQATRTQLLAGGRYLLVYFYPPTAPLSRFANLYNTATGNCLDADPFGVKVDAVIPLSIDIPAGQDIAFVATAAQYCVKIQRVDLESGFTEELWRTVLPTEILSLEWPEMTLLGDTLLISYGRVSCFYTSDRPKTLLINWATNKFTYLSLPKTDSLELALSEGYIYAMFRNTSLDNHSLNIYALPSLRWKEIDSLATYESHSHNFHSTPIISERFAIMHSSAALAVHKNPLRLDSLKILLYLTPASKAASAAQLARTNSKKASLRRTVVTILPSTHRRQDVPAPTLISYHFNPATRDFARISQAPAPALPGASTYSRAGLDVRELTYSGYASVGDGIVDLQSGRMRQVGLAPDTHTSSVTPYSTAIAALDTEKNEVEILQFL